MQNFLIVGITISSLLGLLVLNKKARNKADIIFGIWQIILVLHFLFLFFRYSGLQWDYPHLIGLDTSFSLLHAPALYLYVQALTSPGQRKLAGYFWHILPFLLVNILLVFSFYFLSSAEKMELYRSLSAELEYSIVDISFMLQGILYFYLSLRLIKRYKRAIHEKFSKVEKINLDWLGKILIVFGVGFGANILLNFLFYADIISLTFLGELSYTAFCLLLIFLGFYGIRKTPLFADLEKGEGTRENGRYLKSGMKEEDLAAYNQLIKEHMRTRKPFLNGNLTLSDLAGQLDISSNHLSQVINQTEGKSFYDFVNEYRVEEVKHKLEDEKFAHYKILAIALDSGFSSKSVFNAYFKKSTRTTPQAYRAVHKANQLSS